MIVTAKDNKVVLEPVFQITRSAVVMQITEGVPKIKQKIAYLMSNSVQAFFLDVERVNRGISQICTQTVEERESSRKLSGGGEARSGRDMV